MKKVEKTIAGLKKNVLLYGQQTKGNIMSLKKQYRDLETRVFANLRFNISSSKDYSSFLKMEKCIKVSIQENEDLAELVEVNGILTFLNKQGYQLSVFTVSLESLIEILER